MDGDAAHREKHMLLLSACIITSVRRQRSIGHYKGTSSTWKITGVSMPSVLRPRFAKSSFVKFERHLVCA